jgi:hypothetical protein
MKTYMNDKWARVIIARKLDFTRTIEFAQETLESQTKYEEGWQMFTPEMLALFRRKIKEMKRAQSELLRGLPDPNTDIPAKPEPIHR